ncbi:glycerol/H+ symporter [Grosmannia clavigera kw1407]|uniref:Glycerol/H+ symporter n=1 Tax=Grosmannia clavigera (strain kw1407 / UAMH 11150) TaxID=655863 RepID=F0XN36_GROCL|nr:glycerol/H+ symporter [Grosmannia clavigera kw1407]EFX00939.1 glycerol/H+ symporter [Grosmannia clavigera kw1407]
MGFLRVLRSVYDVDTLDTRFTTPSTVPYRAAVADRYDNGNDSSVAADDSKISSVRAEISKRAEPSKWRSPEYLLYIILISIAMPFMFWIPYSVSRPPLTAEASDPRYSKYESKLAPGWIPGRKIDISDSQYHTFRTNLPFMAILLVFHPLLRRGWNAVNPNRQKATSPSARSPMPATEQADARLQQRLSFDHAFAYVFLVALHGISAAKVLLILYINYNIATALPRRYVPAVTWLFNISTLFANELASGYRLANVASLLTTGSWQTAMWQGDGAVDGSLVQWGHWLDSFGGVMSRWEVLFNLTVLRLISFNMDHYWSRASRGSSTLEVRNTPASSRSLFDTDAPKKKQLDPANLSERDRVSISAQPQDFSFRNYLAYIVYAPLYLTGPIITFNDFISQARYRSATIETRRTLQYAVRFLFCLLAMELVLHYDYVGAISQAAPLWSSYTPAQLSLLSYFNLHVIWLKLLLPWRLFRLWALLDGVDAPENMLRCVSNNYSTLSFWRAWHRSFNRWLVRYIWIPLGGSNFRSWRGVVRSLLTYVLVFTFVALWHDIQLRLLIWGWLVVLFFVPEVAATYLFPRRRWEAHLTAYRMLCCAGAVINVLMMMSANLVGFAVGWDGLQNIIYGILHDWPGVLFFVVACSVLFFGVQVMFEIRQTELRRGILLKC